jgi:hypothetical protein
MIEWQVARRPDLKSISTAIPDLTEKMAVIEFDCGLTSLSASEVVM